MYRSTRPSRRTVALATAAVAIAALALGPTSAATAAPPVKCDTRNNNTIAKLTECITADGVFEHMAALQGIATANGGNRAAGLPGYEKSVEYVVATLKAAGWNVSIDEFPYTYVGPAELQQLTPVNATYPTGGYTGTGYGTVQGNVIPIDLALTGDRLSTSGCEAADFAGINFSGTSDIALIQRGSCAFAIKAVNAQAAGAEAVIMFNQGDTVGAGDRLGLIVGTLVPSTAPVTIPVVGASFAQGVALAAPGSTARVKVPSPESRPQKNVIAELPGRTSDNIVMAGAHLDSVPAGPGINDNGSGSAALLELAQNISKLKPENTIRLAWWGAEESGLVGSTQYVLGLSQAEKDRIGLYLNFDMVASPNYIFMVYDGDQSQFPAPTGVPIPEGSVQIEDLFESYFTSVGVPYDDAQFSGRSDYQAFINNGIPAGGLFTGAEVLKTPAQQAIWGGIAGESYDQCYHQVCDDIDNIKMEALEVNSDAIAFAVLAYAYSTQSVNGVVGVDVPGGLSLPVPAGPEGTTGSGGGLAHDHDHEGAAD